MATTPATINPNLVIPGSVRPLAAEPRPDNRRTTKRETRDRRRRTQPGPYHITDTAQTAAPQVAYGVTPEESQQYAQDRAETRRRQRRDASPPPPRTQPTFKTADVGSAAWKAELARLNPRLSRKFQASPIISRAPRRLTYQVATRISVAIIGAWYTFQLSLWGLSSALIGSSFLGVAAASPISWLSESLANTAGMIFSVPGYLGFAIATFSGVISIATLGISALLFKLADSADQHPTTGRRYQLMLRLLFGVAIIGYLTPVIGQWVPWGLFWVFWKSYSRFIPGS